jgi:hypothetical protein
VRQRKIGAAELSERHFPPPWSVQELDAYFIVIDSAGQKLAFVYFEEKPGRRAAAKLLTKDEARRIAVNIAKLRDPIARLRKPRSRLNCENPRRNREIKFSGPSR